VIQAEKFQVFENSSPNSASFLPRLHPKLPEKRLKLYTEASAEKLQRPELHKSNSLERKSINFFSSKSKSDFKETLLRH